MDILSKIKSVLPGTAPRHPTIQPWARELVRDYESEVERLQAGQPQSTEKQKVEDIEIGRQILARDVGDWAELVPAVLERLVLLDEERERLRGKGSYDTDFFRKTTLLRELMTRLMRARLPFDEQRLAALTAYWAAKHRHLTWTSPGLLFRQIEQLCGDHPAKGALAGSLANLSSAIGASYLKGYADGRKQIERVAELLAGKSQTEPRLVPSPWASLVVAELAGRSAEEPANRAITLALSANGKSKPSQAFLKSARALLEEDAGLEARVLSWIEAHTPDAGKPDPNDDAIRGLIWLLATGDGDRVAPRLGRYCELCFKKVPFEGARSIKLGNGAVQTLGLLGGGHSIAELTRLKKRVRYPTAVQKIETTLAEAASRLGIDGSELEEMSLPSYGLSAAGERDLPVGDGKAILRLLGAKEVALTWATGDGREVKSLPKRLKEADPDGVKAARLLQKEMQQTLAGQSSRLEGLYLSDRRIALRRWRERYALHPLLAGLVHRLVWRFERDGKLLSGLPRDGVVEDVTGQALDLSEQTMVSPWHPLHATSDEVLAWRQRLEALEITQPFKQAHREVYVLTDAERQTGTYSNRFAAHILRQHQFKALCDQRGWRFRLMGQWDSHNTTTRPLPRYGMSVEYWVDMIDGSETTGMAIYMLISTDQVRFVGGDRQPVSLDRIPPLVFSEVMRDVDLFVGVASVGNDPTWVNGGPDGRFQGYWQGYAFGELTESAQGRGEALAALLPRLIIADRCRVEERFLFVRGDLGTYKIHLGSGNIIMEPDGRYLCIVAGQGASDRRSAMPGLVLPFEGDSMLSLILSKAFLLAADDRITDTSILNQIKR